MITEYLTIMNVPELLDNDVNKFIKDGWQPYGIPYGYKYSGGLTAYVCQVMVKYENKPINVLD